MAVEDPEATTGSWEATTKLPTATTEEAFMEVSIEIVVFKTSANHPGLRIFYLLS